MPYLPSTTPHTAASKATAIAVLTGRTGSGQTTTQILSGGQQVFTTAYPDRSWVAVHEPGHRAPAVLAAEAVPNGLRLTGFLHVDGQVVPSEERAGAEWTVRACAVDQRAVVTCTPSTDAALPRVLLTYPALPATAAREDS
ncbi:hypothetical protein [Kitasatospora sp. NE20-6]|uniref:hypothetical protein n=1 Tax=Kitasatospora sp. NE20-6 TaxID=2859066 RepID=UPI0038B26EB1